MFNSITPLHPIIVHFPIVMLLLGAIAQIIALWKKNFYDKAASFLLVGGFLSGIAAYMTGDDAEEFARSHYPGAHSLVETHQDLAFFTLFVFGIAIAAKLLRYIRPMKILTVAVIAFSILGSGLLFATGHYGGQIVYHSNNAQVQAPQGNANTDRD